MTFETGEAVRVVTGPFGGDWEEMLVVRDGGPWVVVHSSFLHKDITVDKNKVYPINAPEK